jgi:hypothetical protein
LLDCFESLGFLAQQSILFFGEIQTDSKLSDFVRQCGGIFVRRGHQ